MIRVIVNSPSEKRIFDEAIGRYAKEVLGRHDYLLSVGVSREQALQSQLDRERAVVRAMQYRFSHRHPIREFFWRKPWKSTAPRPTLNRYGIGLYLQELLQWLRNAHDCTDPSIGCSCHPSYRFPNSE